MATDATRREPNETASRDQTAALQLARLRKTLAWAYDRVPHYRAKFEAAGVHPDDLRELVHTLYARDYQLSAL